MLPPAGKVCTQCSQWSQHVPVFCPTAVTNSFFPSCPLSDIAPIPDNQEVWADGDNSLIIEIVERSELPDKEVGRCCRKNASKMRFQCLQAPLLACLGHVRLCWLFYLSLSAWQPQCLLACVDFKLQPRRLLWHAGSTGRTWSAKMRASLLRWKRKSV